MKRLFCSIVVALLLLGASAALAETRTSGLFTYELKGNGTATITGFDWNANGGKDIFVPNLIDGYQVTAIGDKAFYRDG